MYVCVHVCVCACVCVSFVLLFCSQQINDSSFMVSILRTAMLHGGDVDKAMEWYPKVSSQEEVRANKYWVMYGNTDDLQSKRYAQGAGCVEGTKTSLKSHTEHQDSVLYYIA